MAGIFNNGGDQMNEVLRKAIQNPAKITSLVSKMISDGEE